MKKRILALVLGLSVLLLAGCAGASDPEPLPPDHPLWDEPRCILTPHISGGNHFIGTRERIFVICLENARRFAAGQEAVNLVDRTTGYRVSQP